MRCWGWWWPRRLFEAHPEWHEGELTRVRAQLVSRQHMAEVAMAVGWAIICA
jgi:dsRNA-specific ribonuclease